MKRIFLAAVLICPLAMVAQEIKPIDVKPGLWENTTTSQISGLTMPQLTPDQLARMPPQVRERMEATQKGTPQTQTTKVCITREQLSKPMLGNANKSCTYKLTNSSSSSQTIHVECSPGNNKTVGDLTLQRVDSEHLKGDMLMKTTSDSSTKGSMGQNMTIKIAFDNRFLSSDCGDVKPAENDK